MVRIVHFSDWHDHWRGLPAADIYICTGDMLRNYPYYWHIDKNDEITGQSRWVQEFRKQGGARSHFSTRDAPVVVVRGNHDFIDLAPIFGGECFEVNLDPARTVEYCGLRIGGFRGVSPIGGCWSDELSFTEMTAALARLPDNLDILVSHTPPQHILSDCLGAPPFYNWLYSQYLGGKQLPKACCFGHVHEEGGKQEGQLGTVFSNASLGFNILDIEVKH